MRQGDTPGLTGAAAANYQMVANSSIELTKEKAITWNIKYGAMDVPLVGKWTIDGDKVTAKFETIQGQSLDTVSSMIQDAKQKAAFDNLKQPVDFTKGDGDTIKFKSHAAGAVEFTLVKNN